jgi:hypothetical protein
LFWPLLSVTVAVEHHGTQEVLRLFSNARFRFQLHRAVRALRGCLLLDHRRRGLQYRQGAVDPAAVTLGSIHDKDGFAMGHLPLQLAAFMEREPIFLTYAEVKPEELEGYNFWKESAEDGVF